MGVFMFALGLTGLLFDVGWLVAYGSGPIIASDIALMVAGLTLIAVSAKKANS